MRLGLGLSITGRRRVSAGGAIAASIAGLTINPSYGATAQFGTTLTASVTGLVGGETVSYAWREGSVTRATGSSLVLTSGGSFGDLQDLSLVVTVDGTPYETGSYTIRHAPPTGLSSLADVSGTEGDAAVTADVAATVSGAGLSYSVATNSLGVTIDAASGIATIPFNSVFSATTIVYTASNSGGSVSRAHSVTAAAVSITPMVHTVETLVASTTAAATVSGTLSTVAGATGTLIHVTSREDNLLFNVTVNGVAATQVARHASYRTSGTSFRTSGALFYVPQGNGAWSVARATGATTHSCQIQAYRLTGGTLRSFTVETRTENPATTQVFNLSIPVTWRDGDWLISSLLNDQNKAPTPGTWDVDASFTQSSGSVQAYLTGQKQTADGSATLAYNSVVARDVCSWMVVTASQYPAVLAAPAEPPVANFTYPLNQARTSVTIPVSGTFTGVSADIYERVVDASSNEIVPWTLIQAGATANAYSGTLTIPASGLTALYREARKGTDAATIRRQTSNFQVGLLFLGSGQSNWSVWAESRNSPPAKPARGMGYNAATGIYLSTSTIGNGLSVFLSEITTKTSLPCVVAYASQGGSSISGMAPGSAAYTALSGYLATLPGAIHGMLWIHGENEANAVTQKTAAAYGDILVNDIQDGYAAIMGQTTADFPVLMSSLGTFGGGEGASANSSAGWGYWQGVQRQLPGLFSSLHLADIRLDMVRADSYHANPKSCEISAKRLADYAHKLTAGGTQNPWAISAATATSATTTRVTVTHALGTDFSVVTLPHESGGGLTLSGTTIQGFAVGLSGWASSLPCTAVKVNATTIDLTHASIATTGRRLRYSWGLQGQTGQTPPQITDGLIVDNSALAAPLMFETDLAVS